MSPHFEPTFQALRKILAKHASTWQVTADTANRYCLEGGVGPATLRAWNGKMKRPTVPAAWVEIGKSYVSYHLLGIYGNASLLDGLSKELNSRMQGKTCFNFKIVDDSLLVELDALTAQCLAGFRAAGFAT